MTAPPPPSCRRLPPWANGRASSVHAGLGAYPSWQMTAESCLGCRCRPGPCPSGEGGEIGREGRREKGRGREGDGQAAGGRRGQERPLAPTKHSLSLFPSFCVCVSASVSRTLISQSHARCCNLASFIANIITSHHPPTSLHPTRTHTHTHTHAPPNN